MANDTEDSSENCDIYESAIKGLVRASLLMGFFGEDIKRVYEKTPSYINIDAIVRELSHGSVEHDEDVCRGDLY